LSEQSYVFNPRRPVDERWSQAMVGLPCLVFIQTRERSPLWPYEWAWYGKPTPAEITGSEGHDVYVVVDGEEESRRFHWCSVRPR
jgi:hypothetical protein